MEPCDKYIIVREKLNGYREIFVRFEGKCVVMTDDISSNKVAVFSTAAVAKGMAYSLNIHAPSSEGSWKAIKI